MNLFGQPGKEIRVIPVPFFGGFPNRPPNVRKRFEGTDDRRSDSDDFFSFALGRHDVRKNRSGNFEKFGMHFVFANVVHPNGLKGSKPNVERKKSDGRSRIADLGNEPLGKMK